MLTVEYQFDLSLFAGDDDQDDVITFELISGPKWLKLMENGLLLGTPSNDDAGINQCKVRVSDKEGLSSDALVNIEVKAKVLNRAPYWKPNIVKKAEQTDIKMNKVESLRQVDSKNLTNNDSKSKTKSRRRRR